MFYFSIDFCHINQSAGHIQPFLSLLHAHRRFIGEKKTRLYLQLNLCSYTRQLTSVNYSSPESNTLSLCQVISLCSLTRVGRFKTWDKTTPTSPPAKLASHCGKSAVPPSAHVILATKVGCQGTGPSIWTCQSKYHDLFFALSHLIYIHLFIYIY